MGNRLKTERKWYIYRDAGNTQFVNGRVHKNRCHDSPVRCSAGQVLFQGNFKTSEYLLA